MRAVTLPGEIRCAAGGSDGECESRAQPGLFDRSNGTKFGRPKKVADTGHIATARRMKADGHTGKDIAKYLGVSRATLYRYLAQGTAA